MPDQDIRDNYISIIFVHWAQNETRSQLSRASLKSLQDTVHSSSEIIVVDNGDNLEDSHFFLKECHEKRISQYIRNADNLHFGFARNQGIISSTANWVVIVDNDIIYKDKWLELCLQMLKVHADKKLIASPLNYPYVHQRDPRWRHGTLNVKGKTCNLTERAGSNCMVMRREVFEEVGLFRHHRIAGSYFVDELVKAGYLVITPSMNWAFDAALRKGYNFKIKAEPKRTLHDGEQIDIPRFICNCPQQYLPSTTIQPRQSMLENASSTPDPQTK